MGRADLLLYLSMCLVAFAVYSFLRALLQKNQDAQALSWASGNEPVVSKSPVINLARPIVHQFTIQHAVKIKNVNYRKKIEKLLMHAGLSRELNVDEFIGIQILFGIFFPGLLAIANFTMQLDFPWAVIVVFAALGWMLPKIYAQGEKTKREKSVRADLPFFADLLALSTEAGLDFISSLQRIADKAENSALADEFQIVLKDIKLGASRADALKGMMSRLDIMEITSFVAVIIDADATGASISQVLKDQSNQIRLERFVRAEKAGAQASQMMLIPMMFFIMPAVLIVVLGPVALQFLSGGSN